MNKRITLKEAVLIDGVRTPFLRSQTEFKEFSAYELGRLVVSGLLSRTKVDPSLIDAAWFGHVIQDIQTPNIAREVALAGGLSPGTPSVTLSMACISSNAALTQAVNAINLGQIGGAVVGGVEVMSDIPIRFRKEFRQKLLETRRYRKASDWIGFLKGIRPSSLLPEIPSISEFSTGESMGESCDKMAAKYGVSREEQDAFALRSHHLAAKAEAEGLLSHEKLSISMNDGKGVAKADNGIRHNSSIEKLSSLKPAFIQPHGTVTAGNSSFLTDGASAALIMDRETALEQGFKPKAVIRGFTFVARKPDQDLLIGPALAIPPLLASLKLNLKEMDVFEFHEAFAGQVLSVLHALDSDHFAKKELKLQRKVGQIPLEKLNTRGGSLSIGHPFAATGTRLVTTAANRLNDEGGRYALVAACAAGGQGHAMILERFNA